MPSFIPKSDDELYGIIPEKVECKVFVSSANDETSKSGNEMIVLDCRVVPSVGSGAYVYKEYVMFSETQAWKLKSICDAFGLSEKYKTGFISAADFDDKEALAIFEHVTDEKGYQKARVKKYLSGSKSKSAAASNANRSGENLAAGVIF